MTNTVIDTEPFDKVQSYNLVEEFTLMSSCLILNDPIISIDKRSAVINLDRLYQFTAPFSISRDLENRDQFTIKEKLNKNELEDKFGQ